MAKRLYLLGMLCLALAFGMTLVGCASTPLTRGFFSNVPVQVISRISGDSSKASELTNQVWLGIFGTRSFPSIAETAKAGNITIVATVEYYVKPGLFWLWADYTTIVTGK